MEDGKKQMEKVRKTENRKRERCKDEEEELGVLAHRRDCEGTKRGEKGMVLGKGRRRR